MATGSQGADGAVTNLLNGVEFEKGKLNGITNGIANGHAATYHKPYSKKTLEHESLPPKSNVTIKESFEPPPFIAACLTYFGFYILMILGYLSQMLFAPNVAKESPNRKGYPPLYDRFASFYSRYVYRRIRDCWNKPICSVPGAELVLKDRVTKDHGWTFEYTGTNTKCINLGSYNYLGFAQATGPCADNSVETINKYGLSLCSPRHEFGTMPLHLELETLMAKFLGVEDAITFGMGFATNALNIPALVSEGCLVLSDAKNHASLILGLRLSGAIVKVFKHNDMNHLENIIKQSIIDGQPRCKEYTPWKKVLIFVEGIYSMEGTIVNLPEVLRIKKQYKAYLYLDEAHSIGALGKRGRGVCDYFNCDPREVDVLMGTFTKSFGSAGGYIAGTKRLIDFLRVHSHAACYANAMSPPVAQQIITSMKIIMGLDGTDEGTRRINQLRKNTVYFRRRLNQMGVIVYGNDDSPVVPVLVYWFSKIGAMVRTLQSRKIATVGVGFPATPLMEGRIRICLSAAHTREQLDYALETIDKTADELGLKYSRLPRDLTPVNYDEC